MTNIHPTAIVDPKAALGANVSVGPYAIVGGEVVMGPDCVIAAHAQVLGQTTMGRGNRIGSYSVIGGPPQILGGNTGPARLEIGDNNLFHEYCTVNLGSIKASGVTTLGSNNFVMAYCHVGHDCVIGNNVVMANSAQLAGHVIVFDNARLGAFTIVHQFVRIGRAAFTALGTVLKSDVPPYCLGAGNPARASGLNLVGLKRSGMNPETINALRRTFRMLVQKRQKVEEADLGGLLSHEEVACFVDFIKTSERGFIRTSRGGGDSAAE